ncbi:hypothetical protein JCM33374_g6268 [Metschnikowia sp. JCM 33374]|nr:hypothetical protein JCM33374_g6268 [Metschnikowia sp. JCM 33374]
MFRAHQLDIFFTQPKEAQKNRQGQIRERLYKSEKPEKVYTKFSRIQNPNFQISRIQIPKFPNSQIGPDR